MFLAKGFCSYIVLALDALWGRCYVAFGVEFYMRLWFCVANPRLNPVKLFVFLTA
jgi:hypothetical protein